MGIIVTTVLRTVTSHRTSNSSLGPEDRDEAGFRVLIVAVVITVLHDGELLQLC